MNKQGIHRINSTVSAILVGLMELFGQECALIGNNMFYVLKMAKMEFN